MRHTSYILVNHVVVQAANAISSPLTYGMPALTGFLGAAHALSRRLAAEMNGLHLDGVLLGCHNYQLQAYRQHRFADYTFNQTRNPIKKDGKTAAIIEEGKIHLTVSLVIEVKTNDEVLDELNNDSSCLCSMVYKYIMQQRMAGGSVTDIGEVSWVRSADIDMIRKKLVPAFILMDAKQDLIEITAQKQAKEPEITALDVLIDIASVHHIPPINETDTSSQTEKKDTKWTVKSQKTGRGWLVPIPIGYQGISPEFQPEQLANCRNPEYPSQYVESLYSLGKWVFPNRIKDFRNCFWRYATPENNLYLITQNQSTSSQENEYE
jgi:CRISPR-associated protein Csy2